LPVYASDAAHHSLPYSNVEQGAAMHIVPTLERIDIGGGAAPVVAQVYRPSAARPAPLVLHLRGGAFLNLSPGAERPVAMLLAEAGAVVVSADYPAGAGCPFPALAPA